jgi:hypothetical protein
MIQDDITIYLGEIYNRMSNLEFDIDKITQSFDNLRTPITEVNKYLNMLESRKTAINKKRKELDRDIQNSLDTYKYIDSDKNIVIKYNEKINELNDVKKEFENTESFLSQNIVKVLKIMKADGFIQIDEDGIETLTQMGFMATHLREVHCLVFAKLLNKYSFDDLDTREIIAIFSCFTNVNVSDEQKSLNPNTSNIRVKNLLEEIQKDYHYYEDFETENNTFTGVDYNIHFDLIEYALEWCDCENAVDCKLVLQNLEKNKNVFLGEFVKAITKINNISQEMEKIAESMGNISLLSKLRDIPNLTLKFVATNQSLYV